MPSSVDNVLLTFPPRPVSQWERTLLAEWVTLSKRKGSDIARAFVSERRGDDPKILGRIVIMLKTTREPAFLVHSPQESTFWVVTSGPNWSEVQRFRTLRAALNAIRPVLAMPNSDTISQATGSLTS